MNKAQLKALCVRESSDLVEDEPLFSPNDEHIMLYDGNIILVIDFDGDYITTAYGIEHTQDHKIKNWDKISVFKEVK